MNTIQTTRKYAAGTAGSTIAVRLAPPRKESIHSARDGHWVVYVFVAVLCLAGTLFASSGMVQEMLDTLAH